MDKKNYQQAIKNVIALYAKFCPSHGNIHLDTVFDDHIELRVKSTPANVPNSAFGMLKSKRKAVPADFDPASLLKL